MIKVGLVGCGRISESHFRSIAALPDLFTLSAICDIDKARLSEAENRTGAAGYDDLVSMLKYADFDCLVVTTPSGLHPEHSIKGAQAGRHVLCEKPMATSIEDGRRMVAEFEHLKRQLFVVKQNRLNPTIVRLKQAVDAGAFGKMIYTEARVLWTRPQEYYDSASWRGTWKLDGGALMNQASHYADLMRWLAGPPKQVVAIAKTLGRNIEAEDTIVANIEWQSGALGTISATVLTFPANLEGSLTILGETGSVILDGVALNHVKTWQFKDPNFQLRSFDELNYEPSSVYGSGHLPLYRELHSALNGEASAIVSGSEGLSSLELITLIYEAARKGIRVSANT